MKCRCCWSRASGVGPSTAPATRPDTGARSCRRSGVSCWRRAVRGLGTAWTTLHLGHEREAADVLGIPYDRCAQAGLIPVAYTKGTDFRPAGRGPVDEIVHWDTW